MFKFEEIKNNKKEDNKKSEEKTILQKIRDNKNNVIFNTAIGAELVTLGGLGYKAVENNNIIISQEKEVAKKYEIKENQFVSDTINYL
jgi:predicted flavoprotein YhiN